jgi:hypothetical protein
VPRAEPARRPELEDEEVEAPESGMQQRDLLLIAIGLGAVVGLGALGLLGWVVYRLLF